MPKGPRGENRVSAFHLWTPPSTQVALVVRVSLVHSLVHGQNECYLTSRC